MNCVSYARTNAFKVKDASAFEAWANEYPCVRIEGTLDTGFYLISEDGDFGQRDDEDGNSIEGSELSGEIHQHLAEGEVVVIMCAGAEGDRYVHGSAIAVNWKGDQIGVDLQHIYQRAVDELGADKRKLTAASYACDLHFDPQ